MAKYKEQFEVLGTITYQATNGLSVYVSGEGDSGQKGQISGGRVGDMVVREKARDMSAQAFIIPQEEWDAMPKNEKEAGELANLSSKGSKDLKNELAKAMSKVSQLEAELEDAKEDLQKANDENANLRGLLEAVNQKDTGKKPKGDKDAQSEETQTKE